MTAFSDRVLGPLRSIIRGATARADFFVLYSAVVNSDNGDETLDFTPEDARLPSQSKVPKMYGVPGLESTIASGSKILFGFANGDPSKPYVAMYDSTSATKVSILSAMVNIGSDSPTEPAVLGQTFMTWFINMFNTHTHPTAVGPSSVPTVPAVDPGTLLAQKVKVF